MSVIQTTLEEKLKQLGEEYHSKYVGIDKALTEEVLQVVKSIDPIFEKSFVRLEENSIKISFKNDFWHYLEIKRNYNWKKANKSTFLYVSGSRDTENGEFDYLIAGGILAQLHKKDEIDGWKQFAGLMNERDSQITSQLQGISDQKYEIEREITKIKNEENTKLKIDTLAKGEKTFEKGQHFYFGNGKRDYVVSKKFTWTENKGGKTFTVNYEVIDQKWNPETNGYETIGTSMHLFSKTVKRLNLTSFLSGY